MVTLIDSDPLDFTKELLCCLTNSFFGWQTTSQVVLFLGVKTLTKKLGNHDMERQETLEAVKKILAPRHLSHIEEIVFLNAWKGKLYREMAQETGYEQGYLKDIGARLWLDLSQKLEREITKKNLHSTLTDYCAEKSLPISQYPLADPVADKIGFPGYPLPFGSALYIQRSPIEDLAIAATQQPGSLIRIKAPERMGKTSLMNHVMGIARQSRMQTVFVDMRQVDTHVLEDLDRFLRWFCWDIGQQLNLEPKFDEYWFESAGSKLSCTTYMHEYLLRQSECPLVIAIDTVHHLVEYPHIARDFFAMLRSWYEQSRIRNDWQKLRLIIAYVAELELALPSNQSPFNVGLPLNLPCFTTAQSNDLAGRYTLHTVGIRDFCTLQPLLNLVGGHPYLQQLAFYWLRSGHVSLTQLLQEAPTVKGIYGEHLRRLWLALQQDDTLIDAFYQVLLTREPIHLNPKTAYRLEDLGLVQNSGAKTSLQCELYRQYFCDHLERHHG